MGTKNKKRRTSKWREN